MNTVAAANVNVRIVGREIRTSTMELVEASSIPTLHFKLCSAVLQVWLAVYCVRQQIDIEPTGFCRRKPTGARSSEKAWLLVEPKSSFEQYCRHIIIIATSLSKCGLLPGVMSVSDTGARGGTWYQFNLKAVDRKKFVIFTGASSCRYRPEQSSWYINEVGDEADINFQLGLKDRTKKAILLRRWMRTKYTTTEWSNC